MGKFELEITEQAKLDLKRHFKYGNRATISKIQKIIEELKVHP
jgi:hypothetical protein